MLLKTGRVLGELSGGAPERAFVLANDAWIRALARRLVADEHAAEDLVQDAWLEALESPRDRPRRPRASRGGVVRNLARRRSRTLKRQQEHERQAAARARLPPVDEVLDHEATRLRLVKAMLSLEEPHRSAIIPRYFKKLPSRTIAGQLGVTVSAVEKRIARGLGQLRARLDRDFGDRKCWHAAPVPLALPSAAEAAAAATPILPGALIMSAKAELGLAAIVVPGAAHALWPRGGEGKRPSVARAKVSGRSLPVAEKAVETQRTPEKAVEAKAKPSAEEPAAPVEQATLATLELAGGSIVGVPGRGRSGTWS